MTEILGLDIGRVIIAGDSGSADTHFFTGDHLRTPAIDGALECIRRLVRDRFDQRIHLISKCYPRIQQRTREWLAHMQFAETTGVSEDRWHFCKERPEKGPLCKALGITHFVDDRIENLHHAAEAGVEHLYWFMPDGDASEGSPAHTPVSSWTELVAILAV